MSGLNRKFSRRSTFKAAAVTTVGLSFAGGPVVGIRRAAAQDVTLTWMSNQRHDKAVKEELFARYKEETGVTVEMQIYRRRVCRPAQARLRIRQPARHVQHEPAAAAVRGRLGRSGHATPRCRPRVQGLLRAWRVRQEPGRVRRRDLRAADVCPNHAPLLQQAPVRGGRSRPDRTAHHLDRLPRCRQGDLGSGLRRLRLDLRRQVPVGVVA